MTRAQVLAALQSAEVETEDDGVGSLTVTEAEWEMEFCFAADGSQRLRQLSLEGDAVLWDGRPLLGLRLDGALSLLASPGPARWTDYDATAHPFPAPSPAPATPVTDERLLLEGTIWLPERGLGLVIFEGVVFGVAWRTAPDLPTQFAGPVTEAQRALAQRPDLASLLQKETAPQAAGAVPRDPMRILRGAVTLATIAALALTARDGIKEMSLWGNAPTVQAKLLGIERGPVRQFLEYLPQPVTRFLPRWALAGKWSGMPPQTDLYRLEFTDPHDQRREVRLEAAEFYVPPRAIGEEAELVFVDAEPPRVKGPSWARDAAFIEHVPWAIGIGVVWLFAQLALSVLPALRPLLRQLIPSGRTIDPDHPELS